MDTLWRILTWVTLNPDSAAGLAGMVAALVGLFRRWAVANRRDALVAMSGAVGRVMGDIATQLKATPPGMKPIDFAMQMFRPKADELIAEFNKTAPIIGATPEKLEPMARGELGRIMGAAAPSLDVPVPARGAGLLRPVDGPVELQGQ